MPDTKKDTKPSTPAKSKDTSKTNKTSKTSTSKASKSAASNLDKKVAPMGNGKASSVEHKTDKRMGVKLNQRPVTNVSTKDGHKDHLKHTNTTVKEPGWTIDDILKRFKLVDSFKIEASRQPGYILKRLRIPGDLIVNNVTTQAPFNAFTYWSGHVEINAQIASSPAIQGCIAMVYIPLTSAEFIESNILTNFSSMSLNQCVYLFPNANTAATLKIPFNTPYSMLDITEPATNPTPADNLGYLYFVVFNQLQLSQNTCDETHVSVFVNFTENDFKVPRLKGTNNDVVERYIKAEGDDEDNSEPEFSDGENDVPDEDPSREEPDSSPAALLSTIADSIIPNNIIKDGFETISTLFSLDKPAVNQHREPNKIMSTQRMNNCTGVDYVDKMSIYPQDVSLADPKSFATTIDEMEFRYLYSKYTYLGSFIVSTDGKVGEPVASWPMSPMPNTIHYDTKGNSISKVPLLQYLSLPFEFWNGAINYRLQVVSTMMQTMKLYVALNYGVFKPSTSVNLNETTSQYGHVLEINQGSNTFDITAEYIAQTPMLHVASSTTPSKFDTMGMVNVAILNKLVCSLGSPKDITVNVFIAGGSNFNLSTITTSKQVVPTFNKLMKSILPAPQVSVYETVYGDEQDDYEVVRVLKNKPIKRENIRIRAESAAQPIITPYSEVDKSTAEDPTAPIDTLSTRKPTAQPYIQSVRHLLRKYQMHPSVPEDQATFKTGSVRRINISNIFHRAFPQSFPTYVPVKDPVKPNLGLFSHYQKIYRQFYGSLTFKIMIRTEGEFSVYYNPPIHNVARNNMINPNNYQLSQSLFKFDTQNANDALGPDIQYSLPQLTRLPVVYTNKPNKTAEFNVPFSSRFHSLLSSQGPEVENELTHNELINMGELFIVTHIPNPLSALTHTYEFADQYDLFFCLGDEARFGNLFHVPYVTTRYPISSGGELLNPSGSDDLGTKEFVYNTLKVLP